MANKINNLLTLSLVIYLNVTAQTNVGIGTNTPHPNAMLHIETGSGNRGLLVTGVHNINGGIPNLGAGVRLMFFPSKGAFRAGGVQGIEWDNANVGNYSIAMGLNVSAKTSASIALGSNNIADGESSTSIGHNNLSSGEKAVTIGNDNVALGYRSLAMGGYNQTRGTYSTALGFRNVAKAAASFVIGSYNDPIIVTDENGEFAFSGPNSPLFIIGNGNGFIRSNAMVVQYNGHVGIGNIIPEFRLDVAGRMRLRGITGDPGNTAGIWLNNVNNDAIIGFAGVYSDNTIGFYGAGAGWGLTMNTSNGNVGIGNVAPTQKLDVNGNVTVKGTVTQASDIRYKTNILPVSNVLSSILKVQPIYYNWKEDFSAYTSDRQLGFSAQEIEAQFPELVITDKQGYKSIDYSRMTPLLLQALKEQQRIIEKLEERISKMEKR